MKKLLVVLLTVAMVSFLFGGCLGVTPEPDDPVDPDDPIIGDCPLVEVTSQVAVEGKNYIKGGKQTITVTFAVPTEPVSVYVGYGLRFTWEELFQAEVILYPNADKTVYTGDFVFTQAILKDCNEAYIYVETCETCDFCKYPYTVDTVEPYANIKITGVECICPGASRLKFDSAWTENDNGGCCGDTCSGLASWLIGIYDRDPLGALGACAKLLYSGEGIACPILWVTNCIDDWHVDLEGLETNIFYVLIEVEDVVGNTGEYSAELTFDSSELITADIVIGGECPK